MATHKEVKLFLTFFLLFSFFSQWVSWDEYSRFALVRSVVEDDTFEIDSFSNQTGSKSYYDYHYYSDKGPGLSFLVMPIYDSWKLLYEVAPVTNSQTVAASAPLKYFERGAVFEYTPGPGGFLLSSMFLVTVFTSALFSALTILLLYKILGAFTKKEWHRDLIVVIYGLATLAFPYALVFTSHATATFLGFLAFFLILKFKQNKKGKELLFLAGIFIGFGTSVDYTLPLIGVAVAAYAFFTDKRATLILLMGMAVALLPLFIYNYSIFGNPLATAGKLAYIDTTTVPYALKSVFDGFSDKSFIDSLIMNASLSVFIIPQLLIFPSKGLFFYHPILLFSIIGLFYMYKVNKIESLLITFLFIAFLLMIPLEAFVWWGAFSGFGLRYMLPVLPFLMLPLAAALRKIDTRILILPICLSILTNFLLLQYGEDSIGMMSPTDYMEKLTTFQVLSNPLVNHYLPLSIINGPRNVLFENLLLNGNIDIRLTPHSCELTPPVLQRSEIPIFTISSLGMVVLRLPFLCLVPIGLALFLIWKNELLGRFNLSPRNKLFILAGLVLIFVFLFTRITELAQGENWYEAHFQNETMSGWTSQSSTLLLFNNRAETVERTLSFRAQPFYDTRTLQLYVNDELSFKGAIENETLIRQKVDLVPGLNVVTLKSMEGCNTPTELGLEDCDLRCLSFKIDDLQVISGQR